MLVFCRCEISEIVDQNQSNENYFPQIVEGENPFPVDVDSDVEILDTTLPDHEKDKFSICATESRQPNKHNIISVNATSEPQRKKRRLLDSQSQNMTVTVNHSNW